MITATNVDVYGSIYVKTDGQKLIAAFKKESGSHTDKWFYFQYESTWCPTVMGSSAPCPLVWRQFGGNPWGENTAADDSLMKN